jgi:hypothetical protein
MHVSYSRLPLSYVIKCENSENSVNNAREVRDGKRESKITGVKNFYITDVGNQ